MRVGTLTGYASSGLRLETQRLSQSASNTANVETPGYEARRIVAVSQLSGGVSGQSLPTYAPHRAVVEQDGTVTAQSNTDLVQERVTQMSSLRAFQANVVVLRTADEVLGELVNRKA